MAASLLSAKVAKAINLLFLISYRISCCTAGTGYVIREVYLPLAAVANGRYE
jgi:hypothetical protein